MTTKSTKEQGKREYLGLWETGANVFLSKTTPSNYFKLFTEVLQTQVTDFRSQKVSSKVFTTRKVPLTFSLLAYVESCYKENLRLASPASDPGEECWCTQKSQGV